MLDIKWLISRQLHKALLVSSAIAEIKILFTVFGGRENQPFWKVKFSVEDFSCHEIKFGDNKIMFDFFRGEKIARQLLALTPSFKMLVEVSQKPS